jgi:hypothetical protein
VCVLKTSKTLKKNTIYYPLNMRYITYIPVVFQRGCGNFRQRREGPARNGQHIGGIAFGI